MVKKILSCSDRKLSLRIVKSRNKAQCQNVNGAIFWVNAIGNVALNTPDNDSCTSSPSKIDSKMLASLSQSENCRATGGRGRQPNSQVYYVKGPNLPQWEKTLKFMQHYKPQIFVLSEPRQGSFLKSLWVAAFLSFISQVRDIFQANFWIFIDAKRKRNSRSRDDSMSFEVWEKGSFPTMAKSNG